MFKKIIRKIHSILGTIFSILFVLWFFTGFVMIYHNFPKITDEQKYSGLFPIFTDSQNKIGDTILDIDSLEYFSLKTKSTGDIYFEYKQRGQYHIIDTLDAFSERQSFSDIVGYASKLNNSQIIQIDTLKDLDRWMPYDKQKADYPLYKFYYADDAKSELYVSSLTGEGLQYTNSDSRFWGWVGAIPHWLYIANLRHYTDVWKTVVIILSGIGSLTCIAGIILGFRAYRVRYKRKKELKSPYKSVYKWHHILGFVFGLFVFTFAFSGMMSLQKVPQWIVKTQNPNLESAAKDSYLSISPSDYPLHYSAIIDKYNGKVQKIEWASFDDNPYYKAVIEDSLYYFDATVANNISSLYLSEKDVRNKISKVHGNCSIQIDLMDDYDNYYIHKRNKLPLPVYKVTVDDADNSLYYINPKTGDITYFNANTKLRKWTYQALHSFSVKYLLDRPILWNIIMWTSMIGGTLVSLTGLWLAVKYTKRKLKKRNIC